MRPIFTWKHNPPLLLSPESISLAGRGEADSCCQSPRGDAEGSQAGAAALTELGTPHDTQTQQPHQLGHHMEALQKVTQATSSTGGSAGFSWHGSVAFCPVEGITSFHSWAVWFKNVHLCRLELCRQAVFVRERVKIEQSFRKKVYFEVFPTIWSAYTFKSSIIFWDKLTGQIRKLNTIIKA